MLTALFLAQRHHAERPTRRGRFAAAIVIALGLFALADFSWAGEPGRARKPVKSLIEIRHEKVVLQKWDLSCGAAALATILTYQHNDPVPEKRIIERMLGKTDPDKVRSQFGFSLLDMKRYAESRGYEASGYGEMTLEDLIGLGPAIVPVVIRGYSHFVIFRGVRGDRVLLADPAYGNRIMTRAQFADIWQGGLGFVVVRNHGRKPPDQLAARVRDFLVAGGSTLRRAVN